MHKLIRRALALYAALACAALVVIPASAHALLIRSNPVANAILAEAPAQVELFFSESLEAGLSTITVLDSTGKPVDLGDVRVDASNPARMTVSMGSLPDGIYTVVWRAISATDGHLTNGSFPFAIGNGNAAALAAQTQQTSFQLPVSSLLSKWLMLAALALLVGQFVFVQTVWKPSQRLSGAASLADDEPAAWQLIRDAALIGLLAALGLGILSEAGQAAGKELAVPWSSEAGRVLVGSRFGLIWLVRLSLACLEVWLTRRPGSAWKRWAGFGAGLGLLFCVSLTAHAATEAHPLLPLLADWLHLIAMSAWLGGLVYLVTVLRSLRSADDTLRTRLASWITERFSLLGIVSVAVIGITGLYAAWLRVGTLQALYTSLYGDTLLIKQVFVAALLALAAVNLLSISPRLRAARKQNVGNIGLVTRLARMVLAEVVLGCLLLLSVSVLTYLPPARIIPPSYDLDGSTSAGDLRVDIKISPGTIGQNTFAVHLASGGRPVTSVKEALLRFTPGQSNVPPSETQLLSTGNGDYSARGSFLSLPGQWQVQVVVRRESKFDAFANFNFTVTPQGASRATARMTNFAGGLAILAALLFALAMSALPGRRVLRAGSAAIVSVLLTAGGLYFSTRPVLVTNAQANPVAPDAKSIAAGQAVYAAHCVVCHGPTGKGDGPLGLSLVPRPANLSIHAVPGVHSDGQLYEWITNGFPGSAMPAWRQSLSDTDRWNLVNFIRTMAPKASP